MKYAVIYEQAESGGWGAAAPDLPGLIAIADTFEGCRARIASGMAFHLEALRAVGQSIPEPVTRVEEIEVPPG